MQSVQVEFFFDTVSPYSYIASQLIEKMLASHCSKIVWRPFLLGGVFKATGNQPPAMLPSRGRYMLKDLKRSAALQQIPFSMPSHFPTNSLLAQRVLCGVAEEEIPMIAHKIYAAYWVDNQNIGDENVLRDLLGLQLLEKAIDADVKETLKQNTQEAVERGAFGAPSFFVGDEMFFGADRLPLLQAYLQEN